MTAKGAKPQARCWSDVAEGFPSLPPGKGLDGWPIWPSPSAVERGRPRQAFTAGGAVMALSQALADVYLVEDVETLRAANERTLERLDEPLRRMLGGAFDARAKKIQRRAAAMKQRSEG